MGGRLAALVLALLAAGCVDLGPPQKGAPLAEPTAPDAPAQLDYAPLDAPAAPGAAAYALDLPDLWLRPYESANATVEAPGASLAWYAGVPGIAIKPTMIGGVPYLGRDVARPRTLATPDITPGAAHAIRLGIEGRHLFTSRHAPTMLATITVDAAAADETARIYLVGDNATARFVPDRVSVRPGGTIAFVNKASVTLDATEREFLARVPIDATTLAYHPVELGVYDLVAVVRNGPSGDGEARGRFLVDFDRPTTHIEVPPQRGEFLAAGIWSAEAGQARRGADVDAQLPVREIQLLARVASSADAAQPSAVRILLQEDGATLLDANATDGARFILRDLPPGHLHLQIDPSSGALVDYEVTGSIDLRMPIPDVLR